MKNELEASKVYINRRGDYVKVIRNNCKDGYTILVLGGGYMSVDKYGYYKDSLEEHEYDLITEANNSETKEPVKKEIEVGKTYKTRFGDDCIVMEHRKEDGYDFIVDINGNTDWMTKYGRYWSEEMYTIEGDSRYDVVFEEEKPLIKIGKFTDQYDDSYLVIDGVLTDIDYFDDTYLDVLKHLGYDIELFYTEEVLKSRMV